MARKIRADAAGISDFGEYVAALRLRQARLMGIGDRLRQSGAELASLIADTQHAHSRMQATTAEPAPAPDSPSSPPPRARRP